MNARERRLVLVLCLFALGGIAFAGYSLIISPIEEAKAEAEQLEIDISKQQAILDKVHNDQKRISIVKKQSLPADFDVARVEYDAMMRRLLREAGVPLGFTITPRDTMDARNVPLLDPQSKKPAYTKLVYEIRLKKVDMAMLMKFLKSYYDLNLLHQITRLEIIRKDDSPTIGSRSTGPASNDRTDLEVVIQTEGIILDGAENRRTLLSVPMGAAVLGGQIGYHALMNSPEAGRGIRPQQYSPVLATHHGPLRDYVMLVAKNVFHGPLPEPKPVAPPPIERVVETPPPPPKEDISPYIKLTGITRRSDGTVTVDIRDQANNQEYTVDLKPRGERFEVKVQKYYFLQDKRKRLDFWPELVIQEETASTNRKFSVLGVHEDGLVISERVTEMPKPPVYSGRPGSRPSLPAPQPAQVVLGGPGIGLTANIERVYIWQIGYTLQDLRSVPSQDVDALLRQVAPNPPSPDLAQPTGTAVPVSRIDSNLR